MILGFGSTESKFEQQECDSIDYFVRGKNPTEGYFTPEFISQLKEFVDSRGTELRSISDSYKTSDSYPDRYSYFWATVLHDASNVVVIFRFSHINRRHAMSPDGWAMLSSKKLHLVEFHE